VIQSEPEFTRPYLNKNNLGIEAPSCNSSYSGVKVGGFWTKAEPGQKGMTLTG
jgi:hypothetical protein